MFEKLTDPIDLIDRTPFIDYLQLHLNKFPSSWLPSIENADDYFRLFINGEFIRGTHRQNFNSNTFQYTFSNGARFHFYGFEWDELTYGNKCKCKIYIPASAIPYGSLSFQINYIKKIIYGFRPKHEYELVKGHKLEAIINPSELTISRIDLSLNLLDHKELIDGEYHSFFDYENMRFWKKAKISKRKFYDAYLNGEPFCTGITLGKGDKYSIQLKVYDKRFDPRNSKDVAKFGTDQFHRMEYKIYRRSLKFLKWDNKNPLSTLTDLTSFHVFFLWRHCVRQKCPVFCINMEKPYPKNELDKVKKRQFNDELRYKTIKGYLSFYESFEDYPKLISEFNSFFTKQRAENNNQGLIPQFVTELREKKERISYVKE